MEYKYKLLNLNDIINYSKEEIKKFLRFNGIKKFDECDINCMKKITNKIDILNRNNFNVSYVIDRLDKEFDLIKFDGNILVNIELKSSYCDLTQCIDNYNLLSNYYNMAKIVIFCYESTNDHLLVLDHENKKFVLSSFEFLNKLLSEIKIAKEIDININVLSIYRNPQIYIDEKYTLSESQKSVKNFILKSENNISIIGGRAGSGKSLLALDLFKHFKNNGKDVCYLTPFKLNDVIDSKLISIIGMQTIKKFISNNIQYDICIIDEAQRISENNFDSIKELIKEKIILLGDINQNLDNEKTFIELYGDRKNYNVQNMKQQIRTDDTFDCYARKILNISDKGIKNKQIDKLKIEIEMYSNSFCENLKDCNGIYIEPSKSYFNRCKCNDQKCMIISNNCKDHKNAHTVVSSEYDTVVLYLCGGYDISSTNSLIYSAGLCYGNLNSQLYEIITRAINKLIIITDSIVIYNFLMEKLEQM